MDIYDKYLLKRKDEHEEKKRKIKRIKFNYNKLFYDKDFCLRKKIIYLFLIIIFLAYIKVRLSNGNNNYCNMRAFSNLKKDIICNNSTLNKGFLDINTTHKGKFTYYDYASNIKVYKDL